MQAIHCVSFRKHEKLFNIVFSLFGFFLFNVESVFNQRRALAAPAMTKRIQLVIATTIFNCNQLLKNFQAN